MGFIWLNKDKYPTLQTNRPTMFCNDDFVYAVTAFRKKHCFVHKIKELNVCIFADAKYAMYINGSFIGDGPVSSGGDYGNTLPMKIQYYSEYTVHVESNTLEFEVLVQLSPNKQADTSCGHGGLWMEYTITCENDREERFCTDGTWQCRVEYQYTAPNMADFTKEREEWGEATDTPAIWNLKKSPIYNLEYKKILPVKITKHSKQHYIIEFDKIYAAHLCLQATCDGECEFEIRIGEVERELYLTYHLKADDDFFYQPLSIESIGVADICIKGNGKIQEVYLLFSHYPVQTEGYFKCNDEVLNNIYEVGKHTADICRQSIELDSPKHQENLGCVGDYFIESLIAYYCFGDTTLSRFDIARIADYMRMTDAKMFHTSYSLIWIFMLYDYYMFSGDIGILYEEQDVLNCLLERFHRYLGENSVIEHAPDYMFIDWISVDEFNLHHPPKVLGQAALTAFYYQALRVSEKIFAVCEMEERVQEMKERAWRVKEAFQTQFYDKEKQLYISGLGTPSQDNDWQPANVNRKYYSKHVNTLAALYGLCDEPTELMEKVMCDDTLIDVQPYFMHFVLEALYECGLFEKYGLREIYKWKLQIDECDKGMKEVWDIFPGYGYDYSHAWGATPTYQLMSKLSGVKIVEAGFMKITLSPKLYGLEFAKIGIPTPYGRIEMELGERNMIIIPEGIEVESIF